MFLLQTDNAVYDLDKMISIRIVEHKKDVYDLVIVYPNVEYILCTSDSRDKIFNYIISNLVIVYPNIESGDVIS